MGVNVFLILTDINNKASFFETIFFENSPKVQSFSGGGSSNARLENSVVPNIMVSFFDTTIPHAIYENDYKYNIPVMFLLPFHIQSRISFEFTIKVFIIIIIISDEEKN